jgi:hypothetical protein
MDSNDKVLDEIRKYTDPYSILVIAGRRLMRIRCPFRARVLVDFSCWRKDEIVKVEKVMVTRDLQMVYIIWGTGYHFYLFRILLD